MSALGAWIAAEIAVKSTARFSQLVLANAIGIKIGDRETRDIVDILALMPNEFNALAYFDPNVGERDYKTLPDAESLAAARNREATARSAGRPTCTIPSSRAGCIASTCRRCFCGARPTAS